MSSGDSASDTKTVRACDSCLRRKAWWYCAADDAFLCHTCNTSIHSANPLARRHERVRLRSPTSSTDDNEPTWHHSCKRKARSPRGPHRSASKPKDADGKGHEVIAVDPPETTVPDITDTPTPTEEEQLLYRVPIFDPVLSDFCSPPQSVAKQENPSIPSSTTLQTPVCSTATDLVLPTTINVEGLDMDVESLFGEGLPKDAFALDFLGPVESHEDSGGYGRPFVPVKQEQELDENEGSSAVTTTFDLDMLDVCFDCKSEIEDKEEEKPQQKLTPTVAGGSVDKKRKRIMLSLNYEEVISAWSTQGCPWADGARPQLNLDDCWANFTESVVGAKVEGGGGEANVGAYRSGGGRLLSGRGLIPSEGREARVSRYREKRRTRLFSKKIRYEVRKLNAEKRPRMKGRFVKRPSFAPAASQTTQQQQQQVVF